MPLLDHFRSPLAESRHWESLHGAWAYAMMGVLNREVLPPGYFAEAQVHIGQVEIDVPTFAHDTPAVWPEANGGVAVKTWAPPAATVIVPAVFPDSVELRVFRNEGGPTLVAAVELVSPGNKDRPETRRAFAIKCASYLHERIGLVIVDVVTERLGNLHNELATLLQWPGNNRMNPESPLYAAAYRPPDPSGDRIEVWPVELVVGQPLPTVALALRDGPTVPLDLDATYAEARRQSRV